MTTRPGSRLGKLNAKLRFQVIGDAHLNWRPSCQFSKILNPLAPILLIGGDTSELGTEANLPRFKDFIEYVSQNWDLVLMIFGNHEYWTASQKRLHTMDVIINNVRRILRPYSNIHLLDNEVFKYKHKESGIEYHFAGTTLWFEEPVKEKRRTIQEGMVDYEMIFMKDKSRCACARRLRLEDTADLFDSNVTFLRRCIAAADKKDARLIIMTHHKPYKTNPAERPKSHTEFEAAYETDLSDLFGEPVAAWFYSHVHYADYRRRNGTLLISNSLGYPHERTNYDPDLVVSL